MSQDLPSDGASPIIIETVDINTILKTLPHRYPFLLIDRVVNIRKDFSGIGIKNVTINEPAFLGHFLIARSIPAC